MKLVQHAHCEVVGDDDAVEAPALAQRLGEQRARGGTRHAVHVDVGVHHGLRAGRLHRHLERQQEHVRELARPGVQRREVAAALAARIAAEVLQRGDDAVAQVVALQARDVRGHDRADQERVLADALLVATPARVAHHVGHRRERLVRADRAHLAADRSRHAADQRGIPGGAVVERRRELRGAFGHEAAERLFVRDRRNAEPRVLDQMALERIQRVRALARRDGPTAERPRDLPDAVAQQLALIDRRAHEHALERREVAARGIERQPHGTELRDLLVARHPREQIRAALLGRKRRIAKCERSERRIHGGTSRASGSYPQPAVRRTVAMRAIRGRAPAATRARPPRAARSGDETSHRELDESALAGAEWGGAAEARGVTLQEEAPRESGKRIVPPLHFQRAGRGFGGAWRAPRLSLTARSG